ncbi:PfkB family carbohydrate kinase [Synechococcus sp. PROS-U-1]|uniref:PfkB family carbohydrate kinase n=1 Tax=Synechococcus sp. PROS-U-1 TaxID=1400866 RepID=UPI0016485D4E|nr:PfkB family carbohydrate kinase [Synechococcus sp. PROS-U-1]QNJ01746.1 cytidyltransferase-like domain protein [Synechococcus sp. PROS-U-1]
MDNILLTSKSKSLVALHGCILVYGHFSTIHPGHIRYLKHAKQISIPLVVALAGDGKPGDEQRYPFTQAERAESLKLLGIADGIFLLDKENLEEAILSLRPRELILGTEFQKASWLKNPLRTLQKQGGKVQFHAGEVSYATVELLDSSESDLKSKRKAEFIATCKRQNLSKKDIINSIDSWKNTRLVVLGDTVVDQYAACEALGMSAEAPVIVVKELAQKTFIGAAAIVAAHVRALGAQCHLVSVLGQDDEANLVSNQLQKQDIQSSLIIDPDRPTTFKKRYMVENQKLFRVSRLEDHALSLEMENIVIDKLTRLAPNTDGIIISDFVYGVITPKILRAVTKLSEAYNIPLFGDVQCSSQVGSIRRFKDFALLSPNERELRLSYQDKESGIEVLSQRLIKESMCHYLLVKMSSSGFIAYERKQDGSVYSQPFPALSVNPLDVTGAGDSVLSCMSIGLSSGQGLMATAALSSCIAAIAVESVGNTAIDARQLIQKFDEYFDW